MFACQRAHLHYLRPHIRSLHARLSSEPLKALRRSGLVRAIARVRSVATPLAIGPRIHIQDRAAQAQWQCQRSSRSARIQKRHRHSHARGKRNATSTPQGNVGAESTLPISRLPPEHGFTRKHHKNHGTEHNAQYDTGTGETPQVPHRCSAMRSFHGRKCTRAQRGGTAIILGTRCTGMQVIKHGGGDSGHRVADHQHPH